VLAVDDRHVAFCEYNRSVARIICVAVATLANEKLLERTSDNDHQDSYSFTVCVFVLIFISALKNLRKLNLNSTSLSALTFEGLKVIFQIVYSNHLNTAKEGINCQVFVNRSFSPLPYNRGSPTSKKQNIYNILLINMTQLCQIKQRYTFHLHPVFIE
jgi:hypothetical protein